MHSMGVAWLVLFHDEFEPEFDALPAVVADELLASTKLLAQFGPQLGRPRSDTLKGSRHANMKELRFDAARRLARRLRFRSKDATPFCWWRATRPESGRNIFIGSSLPRPMRGLPAT